VEGGLDKFSKVSRLSTTQLRSPFLFKLCARANWRAFSWGRQGYEKFGFNVSETGDITYREWAPNAIEAALVGDFSTSVWYLGLVELPVKARH
jgi:hypothetical protein